MKIGIMGAMPEEVAGIRAVLEVVETKVIGGRTYYSGRWHGVDIVLVFSHWGKVAAATTATTLLDRFAVDRILFIGVAGGVHPDLRVGDVVVSSELLQHDMDVSPLPGLQKFEIPLLGRIRFPSPPEWVAEAVKVTESYLASGFAEELTAELRGEFHLHAPKVRAGLIASGDQFMSDSAAVARLRGLLPDLHCVEMEGAAVAQVCYEFWRPCLVVRILSDSANEEAVADFQKFVAAVVTPMTVGIVAGLIRDLAASGPQ